MIELLSHRMMNALALFGKRQPRQNMATHERSPVP
jgi:hypothetical protein